MPKLLQKLEIARCPHCSIANPNLSNSGFFPTTDHSGKNARFWSAYICSTCGGVVVASAPAQGYEIDQIFPQPESVDPTIPSNARSYLQQALQSLHAPAGAIMLAASAVDAMLKAKSYKTGSLHSRIEQAASDHVITGDMAKWAHQVRLDANDQRHADEAASLPDTNDARRCIAFTKALGEFMFVLPGRVLRGLAESKPASGSPPKS